MAELRTRTIHKEVWVPSAGAFTFREQVDAQTGVKKFILKGMMLPFGKVSRNNVLYNEGSVREKHKDLIGRPLMYNHKVEDLALPKGHFIESECKDDGWYYTADVDPEERDLIRKLQRGDLRHVSIQLIGGRVEERYDPQNGRSFTEAFVSDIIEGSIVPAPGFLDTTAQFAEAFKTSEDMTLGTAGGAVAPAKLPEDEKLGEEDPAVAAQFPMDQFQKGLVVETEHTDDPIAAARIVLDHLSEDREYYTKLATVEPESLAEMFINTLGEAEVVKIITEEGQWRT